jgi:hypothetical protein
MTVDCAAFFFAWFRVCAPSVLIGHVARMVNPAAIKEANSDSHASCFLCVNMTVSTPPGRNTRRASAKISVIRRS